MLLRQLKQNEEAKGEDDKVEELLPLKKVDVKAVITGASATVDIELCYQNPREEQSIEATYEFPLEKQTILSKLSAQIDGKIVETKVQSKEEAKETYDDAIAGGNAAVMA